MIGLACTAFALQGFEGNAIGFGVMLLDRGQQAEVLGGGAEQARMLLGFAALLGEFRCGSAVPVLLGLGGELRIHRCVLVGFAFNRQLQAAAQDGLLLLVAELLGIVHHQLRVQQAEVGEGVFRFLRCGVTKQLGQVLVAQLLGHL